MEALGHRPVWYLETEEGGHEGGGEGLPLARRDALVREFLWAHLGQAGPAPHSVP